MKGHTGDVNSVGFNHDGTKIVSGSSDNTIRVWNVDTGECILTLKGHTNRVLSVGFNHDGTKIVSGSDDETIRVWDIDVLDKKQLIHNKDVYAVTFNKDGTKVASGSKDKTIKIWDVTTSKLDMILEGHKKWVKSIAYNHDGTKLASGSSDNNIIIWNTKTGKIEKILKMHTGPIKSVAFNADGTRLVSYSQDKLLLLWNLSKIYELEQVEVSPENEYTKRPEDRRGDLVYYEDKPRRDIVSLYGFRFAPTHYERLKLILFCSDEGKVYQSIEHSTDRFGTSVICCAHDGFSDGEPITLNNDRFANRRYDGKPNEQRNKIVSAAFNNNGTNVAIGLKDNTIEIYDISNVMQMSKDRWSPKEKPIVLKGHTDLVLSLAFSFDGYNVISGSKDNTVKIWDVKSGKLVDTFSNHKKTVYSVGFNHDSTKIVSGSKDKTVQIQPITKLRPPVISMDQCKNKLDGLLYEPWEKEDYRNTVFLKFTLQNGSKETWCLTEKFYPADPNVPGDTDETVSRDNYVDNMLYANWVEKSDGSPYTVDQRMGRDGQPGLDRYVRITSIFDGYARYVLFDDVLKRVITIKKGNGRTRDNSKIGFNNDVQYPLIIHLEYAKHVAIGNIRGTLGISESHGNVSDDVYRVTRIEEKNNT